MKILLLLTLKFKVGLNELLDNTCKDKKKWDQMNQISFEYKLI